jgi:excisionase family DNA binding protein
MRSWEDGSIPSIQSITSNCRPCGGRRTLEVRKRRQGLKPTPAVASRAVTAASAPAVVPGRPALTAKEAASRIGIASSTLYRRIRSGLYTFLIPGAGREVRIDPDKLEAFLRQEK